MIGKVALLILSLALALFFVGCKELPFAEKAIETSFLPTDYDGGMNPKRGSYTLLPKTATSDFVAKGDYCKSEFILVEQVLTDGKQAEVEVDCSKAGMQCAINLEGLAFCIMPGEPEFRVQMHNKFIAAFDAACGDAEKLFGPIKTMPHLDGREGPPYWLMQ